VPFVLRSIDEADAEFLALPPDVREVFIAAFRELAASGSPVTSAVGWYTEELPQRRRIAPEGVFSLHVGGLWRGAFYRSGDSLVFIGFGFRLPEFYDKLKRLRTALADQGTSPAGSV
jgi:hypothetical protein